LRHLVDGRRRYQGFVALHIPDDLAKGGLAINGQFKYQIVSGLVNQFLR
jgi:hypothetical protein